MQKVFIKSYGCQMNVYDAQRMADALAPNGYVETKTIEDAELVVLNTCHIREKAADKVYSELGRIRRMKRDRKAEGLSMQVVVAGCVAQAEGAEILRREPAVDLVIGPKCCRPPSSNPWSIPNFRSRTNSRLCQIPVRPASKTVASPPL